MSDKTILKEKKEEKRNEHAGEPVKDDDEILDHLKDKHSDRAAYINKLRKSFAVTFSSSRFNQKTQLLLRAASFHFFHITTAMNVTTFTLKSRQTIKVLILNDSDRDLYESVRVAEIFRSHHLHNLPDSALYFYK